MELKDIITKLADLERETRETIDSLWEMRDTLDAHGLDVADYLHCELTAIVVRIADLAETELSEDYEQIETYETEDASEICDWWDNLDLVDKTELANVPYPTCNYGRGDEYYECEERCDKWWQSRTYEQKKEIYDENCETY